MIMKFDFTQGNILRPRPFLQLLDSLVIPHRHRYKPKWAVNSKTPPNCQLALTNFDAFYKPYLGDLWPSIRVSLISLPKYAAVINKYGDVGQISSQLNHLNVTNLLARAQYLQDRETASQLSPAHSDSEPEPQENIRPALLKQQGAVGAGAEWWNETGDLSVLKPGADLDSLASDDLNAFIPAAKVYSENEQLLREEISMNSFEPRDTKIDILPFEPVNMANIVALVFASGDVSMFPQPRARNNRLGYYLMDAASVLPALVLDVKPTDQVLDLCAAPGGKTFVILQSLDPSVGGSLHCNDSSLSRLDRLKTILNTHFPADVLSGVTVTKRNGLEPVSDQYNKVLVDVPCNSDRHVLTENDNNLFQIPRTKERLALMKSQKNLLIAGIKACVPGGTIVYSTCTLSPAQNDGVVQSALEELAETSQIQVAVQDLSPLARWLSPVFHLHQRSRHGQLVLPNLLNNFGPSYFAKLIRVK